VVDEEEALLPDGPVRQKNPEVISAEGPALLDGFEWVTIDLTDEHQVWSVLSHVQCHSSAYTVAATQSIRLRCISYMRGLTI
jgi:hypothetical protein